jgi:hypothetical protein
VHFFGDPRDKIGNRIDGNEMAAWADDLGGGEGETGAAADFKYALPGFEIGAAKGFLWRQ